MNANAGERGATAQTTIAADTALENRVDALDWDDLHAQLDDRGFAITPPPRARGMRDLSDLFDGGRFRSTIDMARHRFGDGRYRYFDHPLPEPIAALRAAFYRRLAPVANRWSALLGGDADAFLEHAELLEALPRGGPGAPDAADAALRRRRLERPTPGPLRRRLPVPGGHGPVRPDADFEGGQFVLVEQRPRAQSRAHVLTAARRVRDLPDPERPNRGKRGYHKVGLRHGVSTVTAGERTALGIIFHDAK